MVFLQVVSFDPSLLYSILGCLALVGTGIGFFFNLNNKIAILGNNHKNMVEQITKLELKTAADYSKIENKITDLETKSEDRHKDLQTRIDKMPMEILNILKTVGKE